MYVALSIFSNQPGESHGISSDVREYGTQADVSAAAKQIATQLQSFGFKGFVEATNDRTAETLIVVDF